MKKYVVGLLLLVLLSACANKTIQLPQVAVSGISEIQNHSEIWVFYKFDDDKIKSEINKNNTITSTHWIINIDKRLPMREVIPVLQMVKAKRAKKTIHSVEGVRDYLSYSDILDKKIALFQIDTIQYMTLDQSDLETMEKEKPCDYILKFTEDAIVLNQKKYLPSEWRKQLVESLSPGCMQLLFDQQISYQSYLQYRLELKTFLPKDISIENTEYILK